MKNTKTLLAGAALAGILMGGFTAKANAASNNGTAFKKNADSQQAGVLADEKKGETHDCKGKNSCKGKGGCKTRRQRLRRQELLQRQGRLRREGRQAGRTRRCK